MAGFREFLTGEVLTAANVNDFLMKQSVMVFADAAARTAALGAEVAEGMLTFNKDTGQLEVFDGAAFVDVGGAGGLVATQQATQGDAVTINIPLNGSTDITGLSITHAMADAGNTVLLSAYLGSFYAGLYEAQLAGFAVDGVLVGIADAAGNRARAGTGGRHHFNEVDRPLAAGVAIEFAFSPGDTSAHTYTLRCINGLGSGTQTVFVNRNHQDTDTATNPRSRSSITLMEVSV